MQETGHQHRPVSYLSLGPLLIFSPAGPGQGWRDLKTAAYAKEKEGAERGPVPSLLALELLSQLGSLESRWWPPVSLSLGFNEIKKRSFEHLLAARHRRQKGKQDMGPYP